MKNTNEISAAEFDSDIVSIKLSLERARLSMQTLTEEYLQSTLVGFFKYSQGTMITQGNIVWDYILKAQRELRTLEKHIEDVTGYTALQEQRKQEEKGIKTPQRGGNLQGVNTNNLTHTKRKATMII